jgi:hypothetical protein
MAFGFALITYAMIGDNSCIRAIRKNYGLDSSYRRPFVASGPVCPPVLELRKNTPAKLFLPTPTSVTNIPFQVFQRAREMDVSSPKVYLSADKLLIYFRNDPVDDCVYITPGREFPDGVVAFRINVDMAKSKGFVLLPDDSKNDEALFDAFLMRRDAYRGQQMNCQVELDFIPNWLLLSKEKRHQEYLKEINVAVIPKDICGDVSIDQVVLDIIKHIDQDLDDIEMQIEGQEAVISDRRAQEYLDLINERKELLLLRKELLKAPPEEIARIFASFATDHPEIFSEDPESLGLDCVDIKPPEDKRGFQEKCESIMYATRLTPELEGKIVLPTIRAEGKFIPEGTFRDLDILPTPGHDLMVAGSSALLMQSMSIGNLALLMGRVKLSICRFHGKVSTTMNCAVPFSRSQHQSIIGSNQSGNRWNECVTAEVTRDLLLYAPIDDDLTDPTITKLCLDINSMLIYETVFNGLNIRNLKRIQRSTRRTIPNNRSLLPSVRSFDKAALTRAKMQTTLVDEVSDVLKETKQKTFVSHPLNYLLQLDPTALQIATCGDTNVALAGAHEFLTMGEMALRVVVRTKQGTVELPIPPRINDNIVIDVEKPPRDAWQMNISKGVSGLPVAQHATTVVSQDPLVAALTQPLTIRDAKSRSGRGSSRAKGLNVTFAQATPLMVDQLRHNPPDATTASIQNPYTQAGSAPPKEVSGLVWSGYWASIPASQRHAYVADLEKAIALGHQALRSGADGGADRYQGFPVVLLRDALLANPSVPGKIQKTKHSYSQGMPHDKNKSIQSLSLKAFRRSILGSAAHHPA